MSRAVLSLGSNVGDRSAHLAGALEALQPWLAGTSPVYQTAPWGGVEQAEFYNLVAVVDDSSAGPRDWLERAWACEAAAERTRDVRWGPRTLDVDVLSVTEEGREIVDDDPELTLPHPRLAQRAFVLVPWARLDPDARTGGQRVADLLAALPEAERSGVAPRPDVRVAPG